MGVCFDESARPELRLNGCWDDLRTRNHNSAAEYFRLLEKLADLSVQQGFPRDAVRFYGFALDMRPDRTDLFARRARAFRVLGDNEAALSDLDTAIRLWPNAALYLERGEFLLETGFPERALDDIREALFLEPQLATVQRLLGQALLATNDLSGALSAYDEAVRVAPKEGVPFAGRARVHLALGNGQAALSDLSEAIDAEPNNPMFYFERAKVFSAGRSIDAALRDFDEALRLAPGFAAALRERGLIRIGLGHSEDGFADLDKAVAAAPTDASMYFSRGMAHLLADAPETGLADLDEAMLLDSSSGATQALRGIALYATGNYDAALTAFELAAELGHHTPDNALWRYAAAARVGSADLSILENALPDDETWPAPLMKNLLGKAALPSTLPDDALRAQAAFFRAQARLAANDLAGAKSLLEDVVRIGGASMILTVARAQLARLP